MKPIYIVTGDAGSFEDGDLINWIVSAYTDKDKAEALVKYLNNRLIQYKISRKYPAFGLSRKEKLENESAMKVDDAMFCSSNDGAEYFMNITVLNE